MWTHTTPDGIEYVVTVELEEARRRMARLIAALWPTYLQVLSPESAGGVEEAHTVSEFVGSATPQTVNGKLASTQPCPPARVPDRAGDSPFPREGVFFSTRPLPSL